SEDIKLILTKKNLEQMDNLLKGALAKDLKARPDLFASTDLGAGLKIGFKGEDVLLDFSDEALSDMICAYAGPRIATILKES
ncbi:MAG TPA: hypothetical protein PK821_06660, partial [Victivallales bacterium]|nr:hypothetical protein [Victivallales bacterium]